jgi:enoyl-CoA hydratase
MTSGPPVTTRIEGPIGLITLDRPETLNAWNLDLLAAFERAFAALEGDAALRVIVVTGAGDRAFSAGGDLADLRSRRGLAHYLDFAEVIHRVFRRVEACDKPTIGAVNGWALGGGMELLLTLDIRLLSEKARLGLPEINVGLFPGAGGSQRIIRQLSPCLAKELMFTGDHITAERAVALGLANRVVPADRLMDEALALARRIAEKSPLVLKLLKRSIAAGGEMSLQSGLAFEQAMIGLVFDTEDAQEGCSAFLEKRPARFAGR